MISQSTLDAIRIIALEGADSQTGEAWYKEKCRWYSREFNVPLPSVEEMSEEKVLKTYYDDYFWRLRHGNDEQKEAFENVIQSILETSVPEEKAIIDKIEADEESWYQQELADLDKKLAKQEKSHKNPNLTDTVNKKVDVNEPIPED